MQTFYVGLPPAAAIYIKEKALAHILSYTGIVDQYRQYEFRLYIETGNPGDENHPFADEDSIWIERTQKNTTQNTGSIQRIFTELFCCGGKHLGTRIGWNESESFFDERIDAIPELAL